jgi:hypothetical protein
VFLAFIGQEFQSTKFDVDLREVDEAGHGVGLVQAL